MNVIGVKGLGVIMRGDVKEMWCHNFKLDNNTGVFRVCLRDFHDEDESVSYYYIKDGIINSPFERDYREFDGTKSYKKPNKTIIDNIELVVSRIENIDKINFMSESGFDEIQKEELDNLMNR